MSNSGPSTATSPAEKTPKRPRKVYKPNPSSPFESRFFDEFIDEGRVAIVQEENRVFVDGIERKSFYSKRGYGFFRIVLDGKRRAFSISRCVWMLDERRLVPEGFEIHHDDDCPGNNLRSNLVCVWWRDHPRLHHKNAPAGEDDIPF